MRHWCYTHKITYLLLVVVLLVVKNNVLAVVIDLIDSVRQVITNEQRLTERSLLHISNTFLNILKASNNAAFCITPLHFVLYWQLQLCLVFLTLSHCHTEHVYPTSRSLLHFVLFFIGCFHTTFRCVLTHFSYSSQWNFFATLLSRLLYFFRAIFHIHLLSAAHFHLLFHKTCKGAFTGFINVMLYIVSLDGLFLCST